MPTIIKDATDQSLDIFIEDSSSTTGAGLANLVFDSAGLDCYYRRGATGAVTALSLVTLATIGTAHADGGFIEADGTNVQGLYRLDLSDAIVATGVDYVTVFLQGATNMSPVVVRIELVDTVSVDTNGRVDVIKVAGTTQAANDNSTDINAILVDTAAMQPVVADQEKPSDTMARGTVTTGGSTTSIPTSAISPSIVLLTNQWDTKSVYFDINTTTVGLQGVKRDISSHTSGTTPTFTVALLPATPVSGDTFTVI